MRTDLKKITVNPIKHGGKQPHLRPSVILQEDGYMGPFQRTLKVGCVQEFVWKEDDRGPFYLSDSEKEERRFDWMKLNGTIIKTRQNRSFAMN